VIFVSSNGGTVWGFTPISALPTSGRFEIRCGTSKHSCDDAIRSMVSAWSNAGKPELLLRTLLAWSRTAANQKLK